MDENGRDLFERFEEFFLAREAETQGRIVALEIAVRELIALAPEVRADLLARVDAVLGTSTPDSDAEKAGLMSLRKTISVLVRPHAAQSGPDSDQPAASPDPSSEGLGLLDRFFRRSG